MELSGWKSYSGYLSRKLSTRVVYRSDSVMMEISLICTVLRQKDKGLREFIREAQCAEDFASLTERGLAVDFDILQHPCKMDGSANQYDLKTMCISNTAKFFIDGAKLAYMLPALNTSAVSSQ